MRCEDDAQRQQQEYDDPAKGMSVIWHRASYRFEKWQAQRDRENMDDSAGGKKARA